VFGTSLKKIQFFLHDNNGVQLTRNQYIYLAVLLIYIIVAAIISSDYSRDSFRYNFMIESYGASSWGSVVTEIHRHEMFFLVVSKVVHKAGLNSFFLFLIFAAISLSIKFWLISTHSKDKALSLALFSSYFFLLHDSTQIRFGMAVAFAYLALHFLADNRKLLFSVTVIFAAVMFHNAVLVFLVMLLFTSARSTLWVFGMIAVAFVLYPLDINAYIFELVKNIINYFDMGGTRLKNVYNLLLKPTQEEFLGAFKPTMILVYISAAVIYQYRNKFTNYERLCYNALLLTIFFYVLFKDVVDLQIRFRDMFFFSLVFLVPYIHNWMCRFVSKKAAYVLLAMSFTVYLAKFVFLDEMLVF